MPIINPNIQNNLFQIIQEIIYLSFCFRFSKNLFLFQYDKKTAQICLPKLGRPQCSQVAVKGVGTTTAEKCLQITRTVCTQSEGE